MDLISPLTCFPHLRSALSMYILLFGNSDTLVDHTDYTSIPGA